MDTPKDDASAARTDGPAPTPAKPKAEKAAQAADAAAAAQRSPGDELEEARATAAQEKLTYARILEATDGHQPGRIVSGSAGAIKALGAKAEIVTDESALALAFPIPRLSEQP